MNKSTKSLLFLFFLLLLFSCKTKMKIGSSLTKVDVGTIFLWDKIKSSNIDFTWYSGKAETAVDFDGFSISGKTDIRVKKDSAIWISIKKFGFEIARALIKRDSVFMVNRLENSYLALSIDSFKISYNIPLGFDELQQIIIGNHIVKNQALVGSSENQDYYVLNSSDDQLWVEYGILKDYSVDYTKFSDSQGRTFELQLSDYTVLDGKKIPYKRAYYYPSRQDFEFSLILNIDRINIDVPKSMKFDIPNRYTKM